MVHEIAKLLLEKSGTFLDRTQAIAAALSLGMPLHEIEEYLDWLDATRPQSNDESASPTDSPPTDSPPTDSPPTDSPPTDSDDE